MLEHRHFDICVDVIATNPSMHAVVQCVALVEEAIAYPIDAPESLLPVVRANAADGHHTPAPKILTGLRLAPRWNISLVFVA